MGNAALNVLLDLDGTIVDSEPGIVSSYRTSMAFLGIAMPEQTDVARLIGPPIADAMGYLLAGEDPALVARAIAAYHQEYSRTGILRSSPYAGIVSSLKALREDGARLFLATSKRQDFAERILDNNGLTPMFDGIYGVSPSTVAAHKDELIGGIVRRHALDPSRTVMVGDRRYDVAGAHANGIRAIGVLWGYGTEAELTGAGADRLLRATSELDAGLVERTLASGRTP